MKSKMAMTLNALAWVMLFLAAYTVAVQAQTSAIRSPHAAQKNAPPATAGANPAVTDTGTVGQIPQWISLNGIGDSSISEDKSGHVGIGTAAPTSKLTVQGMTETTLGSYKSPDGTVQTIAAVSGPTSVFHGTALAAVLPCRAQQPQPHEAEFRAFYASFLAAARANDKEKLADLIAFPVPDWSLLRNHNVTTGPIKDRADFLARYNLLFTIFMRSHVRRAKLDGLQDGRYLLSWHDVDTEYGFEFGYVLGTGYRVLSYTIGPY